MKEYGKTNPQWYKHYSDAQNAFGANAAAKQTTDSITSTLKVMMPTSILGKIFLGSLVPLKALAAPIGAAVSAILPAQVIAKIIKSEPLRKEFIRLISSGIKESASETIRSANKIEAELQKEKEKEKKKYKEIFG